MVALLGVRGHAAESEVVDGVDPRGAIGIRGGTACSVVAGRHGLVLEQEANAGRGDARDRDVGRLPLVEAEEGDAEGAGGVRLVVDTGVVGRGVDLHGAVVPGRISALPGSGLARRLGCVAVARSRGRGRAGRCGCRLPTRLALAPAVARRRRRGGTGPRRRCGRLVALLPAHGPGRLLAASFGRRTGSTRALALVWGLRGRGRPGRPHGQDGGDATAECRPRQRPGRGQAGEARVG